MKPIFERGGLEPWSKVMHVPERIVKSRSSTARTAANASFTIRYDVPDDLPEEPAQRTMRRRAAQRQMARSSRRRIVCGSRIRAGSEDAMAG